MQVVPPGQDVEQFFQSGIPEGEASVFPCRVEVRVDLLFIEFSGFYFEGSLFPGNQPYLLFVSCRLHDNRTLDQRGLHVLFIRVSPEVEFGSQHGNRGFRRHDNEGFLFVRGYREEGFPLEEDFPFASSEAYRVANFRFGVQPYLRAVGKCQEIFSSPGYLQGVVYRGGFTDQGICRCKIGYFAILYLDNHSVLFLQRGERVVG